MKKLIKFVCNLFYIKKDPPDPTEEEKKNSSEVIKNCLAYLDGGECSDEIQKRIEHYLNQEVGMSKQQAVEELLDFEERKLKRTRSR